MASPTLMVILIASALLSIEMATAMKVIGLMASSMEKELTLQILVPPSKVNGYTIDLFRTRCLAKQLITKAIKRNSNLCHPLSVS